MLDCGAVQEASGAWALGALDGDAEWQFRQHVVQCSECRQIVERDVDTARGLAFAAPPSAPGSDLGSRIVDLARFERRGRETRPIVRASLGAAAAALVAFAVTASWAVGLDRQSAIPAISTAVHDSEYGSWSVPAAAMRDLRPSDGQSIARGWIYFDPSDGRALLVAYGLQALPDDRAYQLWLVEGDTRVSGGVFAVDREGYGWLRIDAPRAIGRFQRVGITIEPRGGSVGPTGARVLGGDL